MEIIDLYLLIYNRNEMPELIKYDGIEYKWNEEHKDYMTQEGLLFLHNRTPFDLDDTVEILEKENKIPEKLNENRYIGTDLNVETDMFNKINEIIDVLEILNDKIK